MRNYVFPCNKWLSKNKEDGEIGRDLYPLLDPADERGAERRESGRSRREFDADKRPREDDRSLDLREKFGFGRNERDDFSRDRDRQFR
jgi:hypothetical protein